MKLKHIIPALAIFILPHSYGLAQNNIVTLFDGTNLKNWKSTDHKVPFKIEESSLVSYGNAGSIFYTSKDDQFKDFELSCQIKTELNASADLLFHTAATNGRDLPKGYAIRIKNTYDGINSGENMKLTGSIDRIRNIFYPMVDDNQWFTLKVAVQNKQIKVYLNNILVNDYKEPDAPWRPEDLRTRILSQGTIGICSIKGSVFFKNMVLIRKQAETAPSQLVDWEYDKKITQLHATNFPLIDFHVHLKGGLTIQDVVNISQSKGINYGVAANCGLRFPVTNNQELNTYLNSLQNAPIFKGMQAEGREWMTLFSPDTAARFDYIFTDAMTWTNSKGMRMRLWIKEETEVGDPDTFMEELVGKIEQILQEPIDIYVNASYIPDEILTRYNALWTEVRMNRVINALVKNKVALEISARYKIPSIDFIKKAKAAGVKFTFGTNNVVKDDLEYAYCFKMMDEAGITASDMWMPRQQGEKKIQKK
jgi:hypothetical protein